MRNNFNERRDSWLRGTPLTSLCIAVALGSAACNDSVHAPEDSAANPLAIDAHQVLAAHRAQHEFVGATMALHDPVLGDAVVTEGAIRPDADGSPVDPDVPWIIGSTTKVFVAVVVLQLAEEGQLDLDASVETYFPDLARASEITPRELLQHTSGLNEYLDTPEVLADAQRYWSPEELIAVAVARGAVAEPGSGHHYANTNYILLGELIAQVTGLPWYAAVRQRILTPLDMPHTAYAGEKGAPPMGPGYGIVDGQFVDLTTSVDASLGGAAGALQSTAPDLMRFARALFDGRLLDARRQAEMRAFIPAEPRGYVGHEYGLGLEQYTANDLTLEGHAGSAPAHGSFIGLDPDSGLVITVVINSNEPAPAPVMSLEVAGALTGKDVSPPQDPSIPSAALAD
jgi:D-alanyl-D-alanine carboxypeptidase